MKNIGRRAALSLLAFVLTGCAAVSQWWQNFTKNPIAQIQTFIQEVQTVLTILEGVWNFILPFIPASALPAAQQQYANAVAAVGDAEGALQDSVTAAVAATQSPMPDLTTLMTAVTGDIDNVIAIIDLYKGNAQVTVPDAGPIPTAASRAGSSAAMSYLDDARARNIKLKNFKIQVQ